MPGYTDEDYVSVLRSHAKSLKLANEKLRLENSFLQKKNKELLAQVNI